MDARRHIVQAAFTAITMLGLTLPLRLTAACSIDSAAYLYQHPYFDGTNWERSKDSVLVDIPQALCDAQLTQMQITGTAALAYGVGRNASGAFSFTTFTLSDLGGVCNQPYLAADAPRPLDPALSTATAWRVLHRPISNGDTVAIAYGDQPGRILVAFFSASALTRLKTDTLNVGNLTGGAAITGLAGDGVRSADPDNGLWAFGTRGVIRYFPRASGAWAAMQSFDIGATLTVTAMGDSMACAGSGAIYRRSGASFTLDGQPASRPIRAITRWAAVGDAGLVLVREGAGWSDYSQGTTSYRAFNLVRLNDGSGIELLDSAWRLSAFAYSNSPTRIAGFTPPEAQAAFTNAEFFSFVGPAPVTVTMHLSDPDSNFDLPHVYLKGNDLPAMGPIVLHGVQPAQQCTLGYAMMAGSAPEVVLQPDSIIFRTATLAGTFDFTCNWYYWSGRQFSSGAPWNVYDTVLITSGVDTMRIFYGIVTAAGDRKSRGPRNESPVRLLRVDGRAGGGLVLRLQPASAVAELRGFDPAGRTIFVAGPRASVRDITVPAPYGCTVVCIRIRFADGSCISRMVPVVR